MTRTATGPQLAMFDPSRRAGMGCWRMTISARLNEDGVRKNGSIRTSPPARAGSRRTIPIAHRPAWRNERTAATGPLPGHAATSAPATGRSTSTFAAALPCTGPTPRDSSPASRRSIRTAIKRACSSFPECLTATRPQRRGAMSVSARRERCRRSERRSYGSTSRGAPGAVSSLKIKPG